MKINKLHYIFIIISFFSYSCIEEFTPKGVEEMSNILVVDGMITNEITTIKLSKSVGLYDEISNIKIVNNAEVTVESDNGKTFEAIEITSGGEYIIPTGNLLTDTKYRLKIKLDGNEYESNFMSPLITPSIDSIYVYKENEGRPVYVTVSTHNTESDETGYYLWSYEEIWEVRSYLYSQIGFVLEIDPLYDDKSLATRNPNGYFVYYDNSDGPYYNEGWRCWRYAESNSLMLGSSEKLKENRIVNQKLHQKDPSDNRFSILYYTKIYQKSLRKEAYDYLSNLQKNVESTGSIFGPIPSEMKGNITCTTDPNIHVIGYVEVSTTVVLDKFVGSSMYEIPYKDCPEVEAQNIEEDSWTYKYLPYYIYRVGMTDKVMYAPKECLDCRLDKENTKIKPSFWPN